MKKLILAAAVVGAFATVSLTASMPAMAEGFSFSFDTGNVAYAYSDGYWDSGHTWHKWRNAQEAREYRARFSDHYTAHAHTRDKNQGWRGDNDHDGVPNGVDRAPNDPHRQ